MPKIVLTLLSENLTHKPMDKKFLTNLQKKRIARRERVISAYRDIKEHEPEAKKYKIVEHLARINFVSESTVRNILKDNGK